MAQRARVRRSSQRGSTTVEWTVLVMMAILGIAAIRLFQSRVAATVAWGGDCIRALDGRCAGGGAAGNGAGGATSPGYSPTNEGVALAGDNAPLSGGTGAPSPLGVGLGAVGSSSSVRWGPPGFSAGWTAEERGSYLGAHGIADPAANYWTPFWSSDPSPSLYTGSVDTSRLNSFAALHDFNIAAHDWPWLADYFDVVTPLSGYSHRDLDASIAAAWQRLRHALGFGS
jgi:hypothetical protein